MLLQSTPHLGGTTKPYYIGFACNVQKLPMAVSVMAEVVYWQGIGMSLRTWTGS